MTPAQMIAGVIAVSAIWHGFGTDAAVAFVCTVVLLFQDI